MNDVLKAIKERRSVRAYSDKQLPQETLDLILEAGLYAPTAHNEQPWHFTIVQNKALLDTINKKTTEIFAQSDNEWLRGLGSDSAFRVTYDAPTVVFVSGRADAMARETDCSAAIENMLIAAQSLSVGSVWLGLLWPYMHLPETPAQLNIPEGYVLIHAIAFGYASGEKLPAPIRKTDVFTYLR